MATVTTIQDSRKLRKGKKGTPYLVTYRVGESDEDKTAVIKQIVPQWPFTKIDPIKTAKTEQAVWDTLLQQTEELEAVKSAFVTQSDTQPVEKTLVTMPLCPGKPLDQILKNRKLTYEQALDITEKLQKAIDELHKLGWIHCDIKPSNIMVDIAEDGTVNSVKLIDFDCAHQIDSKPRESFLNPTCWPDWLYKIWQKRQPQTDPELFTPGKTVAADSDYYSASYVIQKLFRCCEYQDIGDKNRKTLRETTKELKETKKTSNTSQRKISWDTIKRNITKLKTALQPSEESSSPTDGGSTLKVMSSLTTAPTPARDAEAATTMTRSMSDVEQPVSTEPKPAQASLLASVRKRWAVSWTEFKQTGLGSYLFSAPPAQG